MILVTGASGQVGKHLLMALSRKGIPARAWIHRKENKTAVVKAGASEVYVGDLASYKDAVEAMKGIDTVYYICNTANPLEDEIGFNLIDIAKKMGNMTFIYHSVLHSLLSDMTHHQKKQNVEKMLVDSGVPYVIIQPAVFMQMMEPGLRSVKNGGSFVQKFYSSSETKMSFVDIDDYANAAARVVASREYMFGTYEFSGEGIYSLNDLEGILSRLTGHNVMSSFISDEEFLTNSHMDPDSYAAQTLLTMFRHYNLHSFCGNAFTLTQILGRKPVTVEEYFQNVLQRK